MIDKITSVFDNYSGKIKNPFIGTIISVWLIHNWRIPFALFNFDKECTMIDKINFIADYFGKQNFWEEWFKIIYISLGILFFTFILLGISRALTDSYYKVLEPYIKGTIVKHEIFTIEKKIELELEITGLKEKNDNLKDINSKSDNQNTFLQNRNFEIEKKYDTELIELSEKLNKVNESYEILNSKNNSANYIIKYFDDIINSWSNEIKQDLQIYIKNNNNLSNPRQYKNIYGLNNELKKIGGFDTNGNDIKLHALGFLFLKYFDETYEDLPF